MAALIPAREAGRWVVTTLTAENWAKMTPEVLANAQKQAVETGNPAWHLPLARLRAEHPEAIAAIRMGFIGMLSYASDASKLPADARLNEDDCVALGAELAASVKDLSAQWVLFAILRGLRGQFGPTYARISPETVSSSLDHARGLKREANAQLHKLQNELEAKERESRMQEHHRRISEDPEYAAEVKAARVACLEAHPLLKSLFFDDLPTHPVSE